MADPGTDPSPSRAPRESNGESERWPSNRGTGRRRHPLGWLERPEMLVGVSAVVLSLCGLFIAVYEATLIRQAQRASVWPHVEVGASLRPSAIRVWVENTGVGPARIRSAAIVHEGTTLDGWSALLERIDTGENRIPAYEFSVINGRVLSPESPETIFTLSQESGPATAAVLPLLRTAVLDGRVNVVTCFCSVYDECWITTLQDLVRPVGGDPNAREAREVGSCEDAERSGI